ncbi:MAG: hypothetical protein EAZ06_08065 [Cytophagales bacterium]|nr:MAG: hypothetical protein EAZ06_08065 [Cytophagales bacterium]
MEAKYLCHFCAKTNTKIESITSGFWATKVGEREVIDKYADDFYRCVGCRRVMCSKCCERQKTFKKKVLVFSTKKWVECPNCGDEMIKLN